MRKTPLRPISKKPSRLAARFVPKSVLKEVKERSGGQCEVWHVVDMQGRILARFNPFKCIIFFGRKMFLGVVISLERCPCKAMPQPHHVLARSQAPAAVKHTAGNLLDSCSQDHHFAENNKTLAYKYGLSLPYAHYTP